MDCLCFENAGQIICQKCHKNVKINPTSSDDRSHLNRILIYIKHHKAQGGVSHKHTHTVAKTQSISQIHLAKKRHHEMSKGEEKKERILIE